MIERAEQVPACPIKSPYLVIRTSSINRIIASSSVFITTLSPPFKVSANFEFVP